MTYRDPEESGLVTIYHPRGNGTDNSPRWDAVLENVEVGEVGAYPRYDLQRVTDPSHRPTYAEYDRYLWLVNLIKRAGCDEATIYETHPFLVKGVLASAILVVGDATASLLEAAEEDAPERTLLAVGSRELGTIGRMRLGSVSTKVVHAAKGPVLVHPPLRGET